MSTLQRAIDIAVQAHAKQTDKDANPPTPYVLHPLRVAQSLKGNDAKTVAVLHDVVEDTDVTLDDLRREGFSEAILAGVRSVTRPRNESYADFVIRAKADPLGRQVKLADLADNYALPRALVRKDKLKKDAARLAKYALSYKFLTDALTEADYRAAMQSLADTFSAENAWYRHAARTANITRSHL